MQFDGGEASFAIYYSFVTLTTLGYGDVIPRSTPARLLAALERSWDRFTWLSWWLVWLDCTLHTHQLGIAAGRWKQKTASSTIKG